MATPPDGAIPPPALTGALQLFDASEQAAAAQDFNAQLDYLKQLLAYVRDNARALAQTPNESGDLLDKTSMSLYRLSIGDLALQSVDYALMFTPNAAGPLQHKAMVLLSLNQNLEQVLQLLDRALAANPHDKAIWASKGDALKILGRPQEAVECYLQAQQLDATSSHYVDKALKLVPGHPKALRVKLSLAMSLGGVKQAVEVCDQLLAAAPTDPELYFTKAQLLASSGALNEALPALEKASTLKPDDPRFSFLKARLLLALQKYPDAFALYEKLLDSKVDVEPGVLLELASTLESQNREPALLLKVRRRIKDTDPRNLANLQAMRSLALRLDQKDAAREACEALLAISPNNLEAERTLGEILTATGNSDAALRVYQEIVQAHPGEIEEIRKGLKAAKEARRAPHVIYFARAILAQNPADISAAEELAGALTAAGQKEEALQVYDHLLRVAPDNVNYLLLKKGLLQSLGRVQEIPALLDRIFEKDPSRYDVALERGNLYLSQSYRAPEGSPERVKGATEALHSYERSSLSTEYRNASLLGSARASTILGRQQRAIEGYRGFLGDPANGARGDIYKELGHTLREAGRNAEAEEAYTKALDLGREETDLFWGLEEVLAALNQDAKALHYLEILLQREPQNPLFLRRRGRLLLRLGRKTEGTQVLKTALSASERDPHAYFEVADALKEQGAYQDALPYYQKGIQLEPTNKTGLLSMAETLFLAGRFNEAAQYVDPLLRVDPYDLRAWRVRADVYRSLQRDTEVLYSLKAILLLDPDNVAMWEEKARIHMARGEKVDAYECLTNLLKHPADKYDAPKLWLVHGDLARELGKPDEALASYDRAAQASPDAKMEVAYRKASVLSEQGKAPEALSSLDVIGNPPFPAGVSEELGGKVLVLRGTIAFRLEHFQDALTIFETLSKASPQDANVAIWYVRSLLELGEHEKAREVLQEKMTSLGTNPDAYLYLAEAEVGLGSIPKGVEACQKGLVAHPTSVPLLIRLGDMQGKLEHWPEAADAYGRALSLNANNAELFMKSGMVSDRLGHPHEALTAYDQAVRLAPTSTKAHNSRGLALLELGQPDPALEAFETALKIDPAFDAAKDGKKIALQKIRDRQIEAFGREALLLEAKLNRQVTKNDLFLTLHIPYDFLDPVTRTISRSMEVNLKDLSEQEFKDLESASYHLITTAMEQRADAVEKRGLTLADVAVLSPPSYTLAQLQRLFGYMRAVLETEVRPDNLSLTPDVEDLARRALSLPPEERTLFRIVRNLRVGLYKARLIKAVESVGSTAHAPLPTLNLSGYAGGTPVAVPPPPSSGSPAAAPTPPVAASTALPAIGGSAPPAMPSPPPPSTPASPVSTTTSDGLSPAPPNTRCVGCGGLATYIHSCGAAVCQHCIAQFRSCPRCSLTLTLPEPISAEASRSDRVDMPLALLPASRDDDRGSSTSSASSRRAASRASSRSQGSTSSDDDSHL